MKLLWKLKNILHFLYLYFLKKENTGLLSHKKDKRDEEFTGKGTIQKDVVLDTPYWFIQSPFNICVYASGTMDLSNQEGIRFSVRWFVKLGKKLGMITGNGYSYLRAMNELPYKYGAIPYELMPDEIGNMDWETYSEWTEEDEKLFEVAKNFKIPRYKRVTSIEQALQAITEKYRLRTASEWYSEDFQPLPPDYKFTHQGTKVGGHAYFSDGYQNYGDNFRSPQTFGPDYGDNGYGWIDELFGTGQYDVYIYERLPQSSHDYYKNLILKK